MFMSAPFLTQKPGKICEVRAGRMSIALSVIAFVVVYGLFASPPQLPIVSVSEVLACF
jgi:hypothetical protein